MCSKMRAFLEIFYTGRSLYKLTITKETGQTIADVATAVIFKNPQW